MKSICDKKLIKALKAKDFESVLELIDKGANINAQVSIAMLHETQDFETVKFMLENGADPNAKCHCSGMTILVHFINNFEIVELLIKYNADIDIIDDKYNSALHYSSRTNIKTITFLLKHGAEIDALNEDNCSSLYMTLFDIGYFNGDSKLDIVKFFLFKGAALNTETSNYIYSTRMNFGESLQIKNFLKMAEQVDNLFREPEDCIINNQIIIDSALLNNRLEALIYKKINQIWQGDLFIFKSHKSVINKISDWFYSWFGRIDNTEIDVANVNRQIQKIMNYSYKNLQNNNYWHEIDDQLLYPFYNSKESMKASPVLSLKYFSMNALISKQIIELKTLYEAKDFNRIVCHVQNLNLSDDLKELYMNQVDLILGSNLSEQSAKVEIIKSNE